jgi:hypothetical protein
LGSLFVSSRIEDDKTRGGEFIVDTIESLVATYSSYNFLHVKASLLPQVKEL